MNATQGTDGRAVLLRAIQIETRNATIYENLAQLFDGYDESVRAIFREMAAEERQHRTQLEQQYQDRFGPPPAVLEQPKEVIEAPDLQDAEALIFDSMTEVQALETGLRAEQEARDFYQREVARTSDPELQRVYRELSEFEETHVRVLNEKLAEKRDATDSIRK